MLWALIALLAVFIATFVVTGRFRQRGRQTDTGIDTVGTHPPRLRRIK
jgi:hypothetical protein